MIRLINKTAIIFLLFLLPVSGLLSNKNENIIISFPVIIPADFDINTIDFSSGGLELFINGEKREIIRFYKIERNLKRESDLARDFILSFSMSVPDEHIKKSLSFFLTEVMRPSDTLSFVTPGKVFRIKVTANKERMVETAYRLLDKECKSYKKKKQAFSKSIRNELLKILNVLSDTSESSSVFKVRRYKKIIGFLNSFPVEFNRFLKHAIVLNLFKFESAISDIRFRSGEKWWIHFHRRESGKLFSRIVKVIKAIEEYSSSSGDLFEQDHAPLLKRLRRLLYSVEFFPYEKIMEKMMKTGTSFHSVQYSASTDKDRTLSGSKSTVYDMIFENISSYTGGESVYSVDPEEGLRKIVDNNFPQYRVEFNFNGKVKDKKIVLKRKKGSLSGFRYPSKILSDEMKRIVSQLSLDKCSIRDFKLSKNTISFWINGYKFLPDQKAGLLKVRLEIFSAKEVLLHRKENILRSAVKDLHIQIPFPANVSGDLKIRITVVDLVENFKTVDNLIVKYK